MSTIFLSLVPSFLECLAVASIFFVRFNLWSMSVITISGLVTYAVVTVYITERRRKFREEVIKYDKAYHNIATDSIVNYEVKRCDELCLFSWLYMIKIS
jgi:ABC-type transport system involved in Fe-S cluster assembly fused permease/ATPase subunit